MKCSRGALKFYKKPYKTEEEVIKNKENDTEEEEQPNILEEEIKLGISKLNLVKATELYGKDNKIINMLQDIIAPILKKGIDITINT